MATMMTVQEQINELKKQIASLEAQIQKEPTSRIEQYRKIGEKKIDEILNGYYDTYYDGKVSPPIDWEGCHKLGMYAEENLNYYGVKYDWPYSSVSDLKDSAKKLLTLALERCIDWAKNGDTDCREDEEYYYYYAHTVAGKVRVECRLAFPKIDNGSADDEDITFELSVEMDGLYEW